jgi:hypothetical protein
MVHRTGHALHFGRSNRALFMGAHRPPSRRRHHIRGWRATCSQCRQGLLLWTGGQLSPRSRHATHCEAIPDGPPGSNDPSRGARQPGPMAFLPGPRGGLAHPTSNRSEAPALQRLARRPRNVAWPLAPICVYPFSRAANCFRNFATFGPTTNWQ